MITIQDSVERFIRDENAFEEKEKAKKNIFSLISFSQSATKRHEDFLSLLKLIADSADPDLTLNSLERIASACQQEDITAHLMENRIGATNFFKLLSSSRLAANIIIRNPENLEWLVKNVSMPGQINETELAAEIEKELSMDWPSERVIETLLKYRENGILSIMAKDVILDVPIEETTAAISSLARAIIEVAYRYSSFQITEKYGIPYFEDEKRNFEKCRFSVIGLGKLGGNELNYFSDIDILFIYTSDKGKIIKGDRNSGEEINISLHEYYTKLAELIFYVLGRSGEERNIYRVDLRLRPEGRSGDLVNSLRSMEIYYESWGQTWERQMLLKASHAAGDVEVTDEFLKLIEPFKYRKYLDLKAVEEISNMKEKIDRNVKSEVKPLLNVKNGYGGIREIEFFIQTLQLLYGGKDPRIREKSSLATLKKLYEGKYIGFEEFNILTRSYKFLRTVEHRLQILDGRQTQLIPDKENEFAKLAKRLEYIKEGNLDEPTLFKNDYSFFTASVREIFDALFRPTLHDEEEVEEKDGLLVLWESSLSEIKSLDTLKALGFSDPRKALTNITLLREGKPFAHYTAKSRDILLKAAPSIIRGILKTADPDRALNNLEKFISSSSLPGAALSLLAEISSTREMLLGVFSDSQFLSDMLITQTHLIDFVQLSDFLEKEFTKEDHVKRLKTELASTSSFTEKKKKTGKFIAEEIFRIGVRDITGKEKITGITSKLSDIADSVLQVIFEMAEEECNREMGVIDIPKSPDCQFAIYGLGKLGGREIIYSSDLDVLFIYTGKGSINDADSSFTVKEYYTRIAVKIIELFTELSEEGTTFQIDSRLRPSGTSGPLAQNTDAYSKYFRTSAHTWERQSFIKLRYLAGNSGPIKQFEDAANGYVYGKSLSRNEAHEIDEMRTRLEKELAHEQKGYFHIKLGEGGIVDIEFLVQALQLFHGKSNHHLQTRNTIDALENLNSSEILETHDYRKLAQAYVFLRTIENRIRILENRPLNILYKKPEMIVKLAKRLGYDDTDEKNPGEKLLEDYEHQTDSVRHLYRKYMDRLKDGR